MLSGQACSVGFPAKDRRKVLRLRKLLMGLGFGVFFFEFCSCCVGLFSFQLYQEYQWVFTKPLESKAFLFCERGEISVK